MMYSRLYLARNLLCQDGSVFISIDDNEASNLRPMCDHIFGEENFIAQIVWEGAFKNDARQIGTNHEYVLVYARDREALKASWTIRKTDADAVLREASRLMKLHGGDFETASEEMAGWFRANKAKPYYAHRRFRHIDKYGAYKEDDPTAPGGRKFDLINPNTKEVIPLRKNRGWSFDQETFNDLVKQEKISFISSTSIMVRRYFHETDEMTPQSVVYQPARSASERLSRLMEGNVFDFPKDETVIQQFIEMATGDTGDIVLDFFAGSSTTAHAAMLETIASGKRLNWIMVQLPESTPDGSAAKERGFENIAQLSRERIRRAASAVEGESADLLNDTEMPLLDRGFRSFALAKSNFRVWEGKAEGVATELDLHVQNVDPSTSPEDIVYELLLKAGFALTTKVKAKEMAGKTVYSVEDGSLLICLDKEITSELIDALAEADPLQVICLDEGFKGNDQLKANAVQTFKARAASRETEIVFRTV